MSEKFSGWFDGTVFGVPGKLSDVVFDDRSGVVVLQRFVSERRPYHGGWMVVSMRYDDSCKNGHATFSMTSEYRIPRGGEGGGCNHEEIVKVFPEFAGLIKWHLVSDDGPMHYLANTLYHAGDRDAWGLKKGEVLFHREPSLHVWDVRAEYAWQEEYRRPDGGLPLKFADRESLVAAENLRKEMVPGVYRIGEGKDRHLDSARSTAVWPDVTDEVLSLPTEELRERLVDRLPGLIERFKEAMKSIGFVSGLAKSE
jgi:hypothetical protein